MYGPEPPAGVAPLPPVPLPVPALPTGSKIEPPPTLGELPAAPFTCEESGSPQAGSTNDNGSARQLTSKAEPNLRPEWLGCVEGIDSGIDLGSPETRGLARKCRIRRKAIAHPMCQLTHATILAEQRVLRRSLHSRTLDPSVH